MKTVIGLISTSFFNGDEIPPKHINTDIGHPEYLNVSPQLMWRNPPERTTSFLIIMEDLGNYRFKHWTVYNIPADRYSIEENDPWLSRDNSSLYRGPHPPYMVKKHSFQFMIFALDLPPNYFKSYNYPTSQKQAEEELGAHILATAYFIGKCNK